MKKALFLGWSLLAGLAVHAQSQLENASFEDWENVDPHQSENPYAEPIDWSSIKTSPYPILNGGAPVVLWQSDDAHSGMYSVMLKNIYSSFAQLVATGTLTNGRVNSDLVPDNQYIYTDTEDNRWHATLTARPDSFAGWYKFYPLDNDSVQVKVLLHTGYARIPQTEEGIPDNWVAMAFFESEPDTADTWTRFSVPFHYYSEAYPEFALVILNSGNGYNPKTNSILLIDDLEMVYNVPVGVEETEREAPTLYVDSAGRLVIKMNPPGSYEAVRIMDLTGRTLRLLAPAQGETELRVAGIQPGMYMVSIEKKDNRYLLKILIR